MKTIKALAHPLAIARTAGAADGTTLLLLFAVAMPLKYAADLPLAVTIVGTLHGGVFIVYLLAVLYAQFRLQWHVKWTLLALLAAFVPFANYVLNHYWKKNEARFQARPIPGIWIVYAIVFFTFIDLFTQLPVMSTFAVALGASASLAGFAVGVYSLSNMFGNVLSGKLTDKFGAYVVLCIGLITTGVSLFAYQIVDGVGGLMTVRLLHGFLSGLIAPASFTYLANQTKKEKQGSRSAITGSFVGIAAIVGPAYSGIMASRTSVPFVFATIAILGLGLFLIAWHALRTTGGQVRKAKKNHEKLRFNRGMLQAYFAAFFLMFSQGALAFLLPLHVEAMGYSPRLSGMLMSMFGLVAVAVFLMPTNRIFDQRSPSSFAAIGLGTIGISQILIGQSSGILVLYGMMALYGVGFALLFPAMNTLLIHATGRDNRGRAYGYFYALFSIGTVAGSSGIGLVPLAIDLQFMLTGILLIGCAAVIQVVRAR